MKQARTAGIRRALGADADEHVHASRQAVPDKLWTARRQAERLRPYLYVWGTAWLLLAVVRFYHQLGEPGRAELIIAVSAAVLSALLLLARVNRNPARRSELLPEPGRRSTAIVAAILLTYGCIHIGGIEPLYRPVSEGLLLAAAYAFLSRPLGRPMLALSLWQLAAAVTVWWSYLGFGPVLIRAFGGAGLIAFAVMIEIWKRGDTSE